MVDGVNKLTPVLLSQRRCSTGLSSFRIVKNGVRFRSRTQGPVWRRIFNYRFMFVHAILSIWKVDFSSIAFVLDFSADSCEEGVPQGAVLGAILFPNITTIVHVILSI